MFAPPLVILAPPGPAPARLAAMLGRHPRVADLPELNLFVAPTVEGLLEVFALADGTPEHGLLRAVAALHGGGQTDAGIAAASVWLRRRADWSGAMLLDDFARRLAPRLLVSADTGVGWRPDQLDRLRDSGPDLRVLHLLEHPRAWGTARVADLRERLFVAPDFKDHGTTPPRIEPQLAWQRVHRNLADAFAAWPPARYRRLRVEDLHATPDATLAALCGWLGLPADAATLLAMQQPERGPFSGYGPPSAPRGADESFLAAPAFVRRLPSRERLAGALPWRDDGGGFAPEVLQLARDCGYA